MAERTNNLQMLAKTNIIRMHTPFVLSTDSNYTHPLLFFFSIWMKALACRSRNCFSKANEFNQIVNKDAWWHLAVCSIKFNSKSCQCLLFPSISNNSISFTFIYNFHSTLQKLFLIIADVWESTEQIRWKFTKNCIFTAFSSLRFICA